jgi:hypothetical protein
MNVSIGGAVGLLAAKPGIAATKALFANTGSAEAPAAVDPDDAAFASETDANRTALQAIGGLLTPLAPTTANPTASINPTAFVTLTSDSIGTSTSTTLAGISLGAGASAGDSVTIGATSISAQASAIADASATLHPAPGVTLGAQVLAGANASASIGFGSDGLHLNASALAGTAEQAGIDYSNGTAAETANANAALTRADRRTGRAGGHHGH